MVKLRLFKRCERKRCEKQKVVSFLKTKKRGMKSFFFHKRENSDGRRIMRLPYMMAI